MKISDIQRTTLRISLLYALMAGLWILFSDRLLEALIPDLYQLTIWQTLKGWGFVIVTTLFIYYLLRRELQTREQVNDTLRESQRQLSALMHSLPGMAYRARNDRDWTMEFVSEGGLALTGYQPDDLINSRSVSWGQLIHPSERDAVWELTQSALHAREPFELAYRITTVDGQEKWVSEQGRGIYSPAGDLLAIEGFISDTTDRVLTQQILEQHVAGRAHELATLLEVSHSIVSMLEVDALLHQILDQLKKVVDYSRVALLTLDKDVMVMKAYHRQDTQAASVRVNLLPVHIPAIQKMIEKRQPVCIADLREDEALAHAFVSASGDSLEQTFHYIRSWMGVPLIFRGHVLGMLSMAHHEVGYYEERKAQLAQAFANQAAIAMQNAELYRQAQAAAVAGERSRIARELHDSVTQAIYSVTLYADATRLALEAGETDIVAENLKELRAMAREAMLDMRLLIFELRPPVVEEEGLVTAIQARLDTVEARSGVDAELQVDGKSRLPLTLETELYRIVQEALTNVSKHAKAKHVNVSLNFDDSPFCLEIQDDGVGFDTAVDHTGGMGLRSIRERVESIGGDLTVESTPTQGTTLRVTVNNPGR